MLVYRDTGRFHSTTQLRAALSRAIERAERVWNEETALEAFLRAGELECGLADLLGTEDPRAQLAARLSDALADRLLRSDACGRAASECVAQLGAMLLPEQVRIREPEGYACSALDPRSYARRVEVLEARAFAVLGVRSIGTSLSACVVAALRQRDRVAERITVRSHGHASARKLRFDASQRNWLERGIAGDALFLIVDEGPDPSGSTFLSVAQALEDVGVPRSRITLLCGHAPNPNNLTAQGSPERWRRYSSLSATSRAAPFADGDLSGGAWRKLVFGSDSSRWPACWIQLERIKQLSDDGRWLNKFEGFPPYCQAALERAQRLAEAGFGPTPEYVGRGIARFPWVAGKPVEPADPGLGAIERLARYCTFRTRAFGASHADTAQLTHMLEVNVHESLGVDLSGRVALELHTPIVSDARMQPHEWRTSATGHYLKLDGHGDGDGHLLPGPCDVCWDLAGAIVEWRMSASQAASFVRAFEAQSGDRVRDRLPNYLLAYLAFRVGAASLALRSATGDEIKRIESALADYREGLAQLLRSRQLL